MAGWNGNNLIGFASALPLGGLLLLMRHS